MEQETDTRKNAELLIKIILYILLAVGFYAVYANNISSSGQPEIQFMILSFIIGIFTLISLFLSYTLRDDGGKLMLVISYVFSFFFIFSLLLMFLGTFGEINKLFDLMWDFKGFKFLFITFFIVFFYMSIWILIKIVKKFN